MIVTWPLKSPCDFCSFIERHGLSPGYREQIVQFITQNTGVTIPVDLSMNFDPFTGGGAYVPTPGSSAPNRSAQNENGVTGGGVDPFTGKIFFLSFFSPFKLNSLKFPFKLNSLKFWWNYITSSIFIKIVIKIVITIDGPFLGKLLLTVYYTFNHGWILLSAKLPLGLLQLLLTHLIAGRMIT